MKVQEENMIISTLSRKGFDYYETPNEQTDTLIHRKTQDKIEIMWNEGNVWLQINETNHMKFKDTYSILKYIYDNFDNGDGKGLKKRI